jgi:UDP-4-amino-4,6-dideoxy-N-acetyl-beta-L-altrosamine transaminase
LVSIPYGRQLLDETDIAAVVATLKGDWLTQGPAVAEFEAAVAERCEAPFAVAFSSGTAALHGAMFAAGVGPGDETVTSAITFAASANCAAYLGATPRFADINPSTLNVDAETVAAAVTERTRAIVPVHFAGLPAPIAEIRKRVGTEVRIVEDAAHALGASDGDGPIGTCAHSDMAVFSFHPVKAIATGEGGMVLTRDPELAEQLREFRSHGLTKDTARLRETPGSWHQEQQSLGFNYRLTDIQSALGRSQLAKLESFVEQRNEIAARYRRELIDVGALDLPPGAPSGSLHAYHLFIVHVGDADVRRHAYDALRERGIFAQVHYLPVYLHPWYAETYGYRVGLCPTAEQYYAGCLSLPCFPALTEDEQSEVSAAVRDVLGG